MQIQASAVASFLGYPLEGRDMPLDGPSAISDPAPNTVMFVHRFREDRVDQLNAMPPLFIVAAEEYRGRLGHPHVLSPNPRLDFARLLVHFFEPPVPASIAPTAQIAATAIIGKGVSIGHFSVIGEGVSIGDGTAIAHHVVIGEHCVIGKDCSIRSNTVIGEKGFGFERDEEGTPIRIPHVGNVVVGDDVEIGACTTIVRATIGSTILCDHVKIDDQTIIAHNAYIGEKTMVTAALVGGSVRMGKRVWIGSGAIIRNGAVIEDDALVGMGAVVVKSVEKGTTVVGNPAKPLVKKTPG